jgi:GrpB-like predicted nucleotidyltransferase (UPF0157 family)
MCYRRADTAAGTAQPTKLAARLAEQFSGDREAYTQAKVPFVQRVLCHQASGEPGKLD